MKFLVDEMPFFQDDCPFYNAGTGVCRCDRNICEHMHLSSNKRCMQKECKYLKEFDVNESS